MLANDEVERLKALYSYKMLDTADNEQFNAITKLAAYICKTPMAAINLIDDKYVWIKSKVGTDICDFAKDISFCRYAMQYSSVFEVTDTLLDARFKDNPFVKAEPAIRYYAGMPLVNPDGFVLGTLCIFDYQCNKLDEHQKQALQFLADEAILHLEAAKKNASLLELLEKQQKFQALFDNSAEIHCILAINRKVVFINKAVTQLLGYEIEEVLGQNFLQFLPEDEQLTIDKLMRGIEASRNTQLTLLVKVFNKNGELRWFDLSNVFLDNRWLINARDVTERVLWEQQLRQLSLVASHVSSGVVINDADDRIIWVNKAFETITGFGSAEVIGKHLRNVITGADTNHEVLQYAQEQVHAKQSFKIEALCYKANGSAVWLSVMNSVIEEENQREYRSVEIITDISEKKKADEDLQMLSLAVKKSDVGVLIRNDKEQIIWLNEALEKMLGYCFDELAGLRLNKEWLGPDTDLAQFYRAKHATSLKVPYNVEIILYTKTGKPIWVSIYNSFLFDESGNINKQLSILTDITARKKAEQELIRTREEALQLGRAKQNFISVMSHEIRTPINSVIGMSRLLLDENPQQHQLEHLQNLKFSSENLLILVNDVLDFTKIETGNMKLESAPVNLKELAKRTLQSLEFKRENSQVKLILEVDEQIPDLILADSTRLYQILINLLGNAVKFTEQGEVKLSLLLTEKTAGHITVQFTVADTGIGIEADKQEAIFEAYTQAGADTTRKFGGTGLGLTITKKLVEIHGSQINLTSQFGQGTSFFFSIKFKTLQPTVKISSSDQIFAELPSKVLVVDDNQINRTLAKKVLCKWAIEVSLAENGLHAYEMVLQNEYDLVLMDMHMPVMGGIEATKNIRALEGHRYKTMPIIALTGSIFGIDLGKLSGYGITDYFIKPYTPEGLYHKIKPYLQPQNA